MIHHGDLFDVLPTLAAESVDACVTDPPYGIGFMGKEWDSFKPGVEQTRIVPNKAIESDNLNLKGRTRGPASSPSAVEYDYSVKGLREFQAWTENWAREVYRVLKPGAYIVVCGAPRAHHRMMSGLEDAGFEIRDCFAWLFGSGFPKSMNIGEGKGTALKPAHEPIALARKPFKGTVKACHVQHGTAVLNIDACRIEGVARPWRESTGEIASKGIYGEGLQGSRVVEDTDLGRWPANVLLDEEAAAMLDEQAGDRPTGKGSGPSWGKSEGVNEGWRRPSHEGYEATPEAGYGDRGGASRFYYVAKPSREERDYGTHHLKAKTGGEATGRVDGSAGLNSPRAGAGRTGGRKNFHPTVKPVELMRWLVRLVSPVGGVVLDPFTGSGTTGMACRYEQREFIGIEREADYIEIAEARIAAVAPLFTESA